MPKSKKKNQKKGKNKPNSPAKKDVENESQLPQPAVAETPTLQESAKTATSVAPQPGRAASSGTGKLDIPSDAVQAAIQACVQASVIDSHALVKQLQSFVPSEQATAPAVTDAAAAAAAVPTPASITDSKQEKELGKDAVQAAIASTIAASAINTDKLVLGMTEKPLPQKTMVAAAAQSGSKPLPSTPVPAGAVDAAMESAVKGAVLQKQQEQQQQPPPPQKPEPAVSPPLQASQVNPHVPARDTNAPPKGYTLPSEQQQQRLQQQQQQAAQHRAQQPKPPSPQQRQAKQSAASRFCRIL